MCILNQPIKIKNIALRNRLVMPPMATAKSEADGRVTEQLCQYYDEKSSGGYIGLIITEHSYISPEGKASKGQLSIAEDSAIDGLRTLTQTIHQNGSKVLAQINHAGGNTTSEITDSEPLCASVSPLLKADVTGMPPREMRSADLKKVVDDFAAAAMRAKKVGFDGVEIHSAHAYLLNQFFSPLTNRRRDEYGGRSVEDRIHLHLEVIKAVREVVGSDYLVALRLGACDYTEGGSTIKDSVLAAMAFEKVGVDLLDISGGLCGFTRPGAKEQGYFSEITQAIKQEISIPVILTGGIVDAEAAERLLKSHKADLIGVGRAILKDSNWARKAITVI